MKKLKDKEIKHSLILKFKILQFALLLILLANFYWNIFVPWCLESKNTKYVLIQAIRGRQFYDLKLFIAIFPNPLF